MTREEVYALHFLGTTLEWKLFAGALLLGAVLGGIYDILRAFRMTFRHRSVAVFLEDVCFVLLYGTAFYSYCTELCRGQLRFFVLAAMIIGFAVYLLTLGRIVSGLVAAAVKTAKKALLYLGNMSKKAFRVLCGVPFFKKEEEKFEENPCVNSES